MIRSGERIVLEIGEEGIVESKVKEDGIFNLIFRKAGSRILTRTFLRNREYSLNVRGRSIYILFQGEVLYIKEMIIPKVEEEELEQIIKNELYYYFGNINSLLFTYSIEKEVEGKLEIIVYCLNSDKISRLKGYEKGKKYIQKINLIQYAVWEYLKSQIRAKDYLAIFIEGRDLYFIASRDEKIFSNKVFKNFYVDFESISKEVKEFCAVNNLKIKEEFKIYFVNFKDKKCIHKMSSQFSCEDLGMINHEDFLAVYCK